ncbi:MAG: hypothetical protein GC187_09880 [Alphaproteobacteria bacterium]|nr:hypothetical protein [Alphaproteobacteria bacterium]
MLATSDRARFALKNPASLGAMLVYDWRVRGLLTDAEILAGAVSWPVTTSLLRQLQRQGLIRALHGVRARGGRMRLWVMGDVMRVQAALDLRAATRAPLGACVQALVTFDDAVSAVLDDWRSQIGARAQGAAAPALTARKGLLSDRDGVAGFVAASMRQFVARQAFETVRQPAFLQQS